MATTLPSSSESDDSDQDCGPVVKVDFSEHNVVHSNSNSENEEDEEGSSGPVSMFHLQKWSHVPSKYKPVVPPKPKSLNITKDQPEEQALEEDTEECKLADELVDTVTGVDEKINVVFDEQHVEVEKHGLVEEPESEQPAVPSGPQEQDNCTEDVNKPDAEYYKSDEETDNGENANKLNTGQTDCEAMDIVEEETRADPIDLDTITPEVDDENSVPTNQSCVFITDTMMVDIDKEKSVLEPGVSFVMVNYPSDDMEEKGKQAKAENCHMESRVEGIVTELKQKPETSYSASFVTAENIDGKTIAPDASDADASDDDSFSTPRGGVEDIGTIDISDEDEVEEEMFHDSIGSKKAVDEDEIVQGKDAGNTDNVANVTEDVPSFIYDGSIVVLGKGTVKEGYKSISSDITDDLSSSVSESTLADSHLKSKEIPNQSSCIKNRICKFETLSKKEGQKLIIRKPKPDVDEQMEGVIETSEESPEMCQLKEKELITDESSQKSTAEQSTENTEDSVQMRPLNTQPNNEYGDTPPPVRPKSQAVMDNISMVATESHISDSKHDTATKDADVPPPVRPKSQAVLDSMQSYVFAMEQPSLPPKSIATQQMETKTESAEPDYVDFTEMGGSAATTGAGAYPPQQPAFQAGPGVSPQGDPGDMSSMQVQQYQQLRNTYFQCIYQDNQQLYPHMQQQDLYNYVVSKMFSFEQMLMSYKQNFPDLQQLFAAVYQQWCMSQSAHQPYWQYAWAYPGQQATSPDHTRENQYVSEAGSTGMTPGHETPIQTTAGFQTTATPPPQMHAGQGTRTDVGASLETHVKEPIPAETRSTQDVKSTGSPNVGTRRSMKEPEVRRKQPVRQMKSADGMEQGAAQRHKNKPASVKGSTPVPRPRKSEAQKKDEEDNRTLSTIENGIRKEERKVNDVEKLIKNLGREPMDKRKKIIKDDTKRLKEVAEFLTKHQEHLDSLRFNESNAGAKQKKKDYSNQIQTLLNKVDAIQDNLSVLAEIPDTSFLYMEDLNASTAESTLENFVEGSLQLEVERVIYNVERTNALLVLKGQADFGKLSDKIQAKGIDGHQPSITKMSAPTAIAVSCADDISYPISMAYYFELEKNGGGELEEDEVEESEDCSCYIVRFKDPKVVEQVCKKSHRYDSKELRVSPYYENDRGAIWDHDLHEIPTPEPVTLALSENCVQFLQRDCCSNLIADMQDKHCAMTFTENSVKFSCILPKTTARYKTCVKTWADEAKESFNSYVREHVGEIKAHLNKMVDHKHLLGQVWTELLQFFDSDEFDCTPVVTAKDSSHQCIAMVGFKKEVNEKFGILEKKAKEIETRLMRTKESKTFNCKKLRLLQEMGVFDDIGNKLPDTELFFSDDYTEVTVEGQKGDIDMVFMEIYQATIRIEMPQFRHSFSAEFVDFIKREPGAIIKEINKDIKSKQMIAEWDIQHDFIVVYVGTSCTGEDVRDVIMGCITEQPVNLTPEKQHVVNTDEWSDFDHGITEEFETSKMEEIRGKLTVYGLTKEVNSILARVDAFMEIHQIRKDKMQCDTISIKFLEKHKKHLLDDLARKHKDQNMKLSLQGDCVLLSGKQQGIKDVQAELKKFFDSIVKRKYEQKKIAVCDVFKDEREKGTIETIEKTTRCLIQLPGEYETLMKDRPHHGDQAAAQASYSDSDQDYETSGSTARATPSRTKGFVAKNGTNVEIVKGEIGEQDGDVMVVSTAASLNLASGAAGKSLLKKAGPELQQECRQKYPQEIKYGEVAVVDSYGELECNKVYLTALPPWKEENARKILEKFLSDCLVMASKHNKHSILFTALGCGQLKYPYDVVAILMYDAVVEFDNSNPKSTLKEIKFVLYQKDLETIKTFQDEERFRMDGKTERRNYDVQAGNIKIELAVEDIANQKVDCILCSTSPNLDLSKGACNALLRVGGKGLQEECKKKYEGSLNAGQVGEIGGGNLKNKSVFLTVLPAFSQDAPKVLKSIIMTCLGLADGRKFQSVAMPALGSGFLKYPSGVTCEEMYSAVKEWATKNPRSTINRVRFIMHAKDHSLVQTFRTYVQNSHGHGSRKSGRHLELEKGGFSKAQKPSKFQPTSDGCHVRDAYLKVYVGDIIKDKSDAIVSSVDQDFHFLGAVAQTLKKQCKGLEDECKKSKKKKKMASQGLVRTDSFGGLNASHILHVQFQQTLDGWRKKMLACLEKAQKHRMRSVAFPVLGSGQGQVSFRADNIAERLFDAVNEYTSKSRVGVCTVKDIRLVIYHGQSPVLTSVIDAIHKKANEAHLDQSRGKFERMVKKADLNEVIQPQITEIDGGNKMSQMSQYVFGAESETMSPEEKQRRSTQLSSLTLMMYSDSTANLDKCKQELDKSLESVYTSQKVDGYKEIVKSMDDKQVNEMLTIQYLVDIKVDKNNGIFSISGPMKHVMDAQSELEYRLRNMERKRHVEEGSKTMAKQIQWYHENITPTGIDLQPYELLPNYQIETAYKNGDKNVELKDSDGVTYVIDFSSFLEYLKTNDNDCVKVIRKDILKAASSALPKTWADMKDQENIKIVPLAATDQEFNDVSTRFMNEVKTGKYNARISFDKNNLKVSKIERIQNKALYQQYAAKKKLLTEEKKNLPKNMPIERAAWHGTTQDVVSSIQTHGFNRSFCGKNGIWFGAGVYFAGDASYSARTWLSTGAQAQTTGIKGYIFLCKILTGHFVKGNDKMRYLPAIDPAKPTVLYDSAVDNENDPMEFVIFHDTQAYPEYIITFTA